MNEQILTTAEVAALRTGILASATESAATAARRRRTDLARQVQEARARLAEMRDRHAHAAQSLETALSKARDVVAKREADVRALAGEHHHREAHVLREIEAALRELRRTPDPLIAEARQRIQTRHAELLSGRNLRTEQRPLSGLHLGAARPYEIWSNAVASAAVSKRAFEALQQLTHFADEPPIELERAIAELEASIDWESAARLECVNRLGADTRIDVAGPRRRT